MGTHGYLILCLLIAVIFFSTGIICRKVVNDTSGLTIINIDLSDLEEAFSNGPTDSQTSQNLNNLKVYSCDEKVVGDGEEFLCADLEGGKKTEVISKETLFSGRKPIIESEMPEWDLQVMKVHDDSGKPQNVINLSGMVSATTTTARPKPKDGNPFGINLSNEIFFPSSKDSIKQDKVVIGKKKFKITSEQKRGKSSTGKFHVLNNGISVLKKGNILKNGMSKNKIKQEKLLISKSRGIKQNNRLLVSSESQSSKGKKALKDAKAELARTLSMLRQLEQLKAKEIQGKTPPETSVSDKFQILPQKIPDTVEITPEFLHNSVYQTPITAREAIDRESFKTNLNKDDYIEENIDFDSTGSTEGVAESYEEDDDYSNPSRHLHSEIQSSGNREKSYSQPEAGWDQNVNQQILDMQQPAKYENFNHQPIMQTANYKNSFDEGNFVMEQSVNQIDAYNQSPFGHRNGYQQQPSIQLPVNYIQTGGNIHSNVHPAPNHENINNQWMQQHGNNRDSDLQLQNPFQLESTAVDDTRQSTNYKNTNKHTSTSHLHQSESNKWHSQMPNTNGELYSSVQSQQQSGDISPSLPSYNPQNTDNSQSRQLDHKETKLQNIFPAENVIYNGPVFPESNAVYSERNFIRDNININEYKPKINGQLPYHEHHIPYSFGQTNFRNTPHVLGAMTQNFQQLPRALHNTVVTNQSPDDHIDSGGHLIEVAEGTYVNPRRFNTDPLPQSSPTKVTDSYSATSNHQLPSHNSKQNLNPYSPENVRGQIDYDPMKEIENSFSYSLYKKPSNRQQQHQLGGSSLNVNSLTSFGPHGQRTLRPNLVDSSRNYQQQLKPASFTKSSGLMQTLQRGYNKLISNWNRSPNVQTVTQGRNHPYDSTFKGAINRKHALGLVPTRRVTGQKPKLIPRLLHSAAGLQKRVNSRKRAQVARQLPRSKNNKPKVKSILFKTYQYEAENDPDKEWLTSEYEEDNQYPEGPMVKFDQTYEDGHPVTSIKSVPGTDTVLFAPRPIRRMMKRKPLKRLRLQKKRQQQVNRIKRQWRSPILRRKFLQRKKY